MAVNLVDDSKLDSDEFQGIPDVDETIIPEFGLPPKEEEGAGQKTAEELEQERLAAEAANAGKTPEQIEQERVAAAAEAAKGAKTPEQITEEAETEKNRVAAEMKEELRKELLKEMGVDSVEEVKKLKTPPVAETDEQKAAKAEKMKAAVHKYAVDNGKMSLAEISAYEQLSTLTPKDIVYSDFATDYTEANKDRKDDDGKAQPVTPEEIAEAFQDVYHTDDTNEALKKTGERALNARAKELLGDPKAKYEAVTKEYEGLAKRKEMIPEFKNFVQDTIRAIIPAKYDYEVDGRKFSVDTDGKDFDEIEKNFKNDDVYGRYYANTDRQGLKGEIAMETARQLSAKYIKKVAETANRAGFDAGLKERPVGARAPFRPNEAPASTGAAGKGLTAEEKANIRAGLS